MSGLDHGPITAAPVTREEAAALARLLHVLADDTRILLISTLLHAPEGELHSRELQERLHLHQPTASHHLRKLVRSGILEREQRGPYAFFRLAPDALPRLRAIFDGQPPRVRRARSRRPTV
ncbi:helix-turn-helix transcriptional regulator [Baekduia soli]|uniref:Helix-turn-helix transcriptional regulator n=1 Tax=Baekduia soli TaxID=496014 RepID=A0A5B8U6K1_9ACTN|nr:metalloregulator ArsR/SmtB family transcription factor [Baekduia soli]QEC48561.1 helix-turn-helix transcriptional regulator [Baekduia soli]